ncbi:uncharacterized protein LOC133321606, partial [Musca vetustissima]|uniref:uncharacterized protein LOC133321606 n=1 Tax=Musca vetustissima TaxID=27455 RepID=UPI002AB670D0
MSRHAAVTANSLVAVFVAYFQADKLILFFLFSLQNITKTRTIRFCCAGYDGNLSINDTVCKPVCRSGCGRGYCLKPDVCSCEPGYMGKHCTQRCDHDHWGLECKNVCQCHNGAACDNKSGTCHCTMGWTGEFCEKPCPKGTYGVMCRKACECENKLCHPQTGACDPPAIDPSLAPNATHVMIATLNSTIVNITHNLDRIAKNIVNIATSTTPEPINLPPQILEVTTAPAAIPEVIVIKQEPEIPHTPKIIVHQQGQGLLDNLHAAAKTPEVIHVITGWPGQQHNVTQEEKLNLAGFGGHPATKEESQNSNDTHNSDHENSLLTTLLVILLIIMFGIGMGFLYVYRRYHLQKAQVEAALAARNVSLPSPNPNSAIIITPPTPGLQPYTNDQLMQDLNSGNLPPGGNTGTMGKSFLKPLPDLPAFTQMVRNKIEEPDLYDSPSNSSSITISPVPTINSYAYARKESLYSVVTPKSRKGSMDSHLYDEIRYPTAMQHHQHHQHHAHTKPQHHSTQHNVYIPQHQHTQHHHSQQQSQPQPQHQSMQQPVAHQQQLQHFGNFSQQQGHAQFQTGTHHTSGHHQQVATSPEAIMRAMRILEIYLIFLSILGFWNMSTKCQEIYGDIYPSTRAELNLYFDSQQREKKCYKDVPAYFFQTREHEPLRGNSSIAGHLSFEICCEGYRRDPKVRSTLKCIPDCSKVSADNCRNGFCRSTHQCECFEGFVRDSRGNCVHICPVGCLNGRCLLNGDCLCNPGYSLDPETRKYCLPECSHIPCGLNQICVAPGECRCQRGYQWLEGLGCQPICQPHCGYGRCIGPQQCECFPGYIKRKGREICESECYANCENGFCESPYKCQCHIGFAYDPQSQNCLAQCPEACDHGVCIAPGICKCFEGYYLWDNTLVVAFMVIASHRMCVPVALDINIVWMVVAVHHRVIVNALR